MPKKTRQKSSGKENLGNIVKDMHGYTYKIKEGFKTLLSYPIYKNGIGIFTKDTISGKHIGIYKIPSLGKVYMFTYVLAYNYYVMQELEEIKYNELEDIRKSHLHGNIYHA